jgi:hypothetical protein
MFNISRTTIFLKTYGEDTIRCSYKDYSSPNRWQANMDLLFAFTLCNLLFITTHLRQGKKVSILPPGHVNPGPALSRRGLLEGSPYRAVGATCLSCDWPHPLT